MIDDADSRQPRRVPFNVRLDPDKRRRLRQLALDENTTAAELARQAISRLLVERETT